MIIKKNFIDRENFDVDGTKLMVYGEERDKNGRISRGKRDTWCERKNLQHTHKNWRENNKVNVGIFTNLAGNMRKGIEIKILKVIKGTSWQNKTYKY